MHDYIEMIKFGVCASFLNRPHVSGSLKCNSTDYRAILVLYPNLWQAQ